MEELAALFEWGQKNLSTQVHYDYGFRTINSSPNAGDRYRNLRRFAFCGDKKGPNAIDNIQLIRQLFLAIARVVTLEDAAKLKKVFKIRAVTPSRTVSGGRERSGTRYLTQDQRLVNVAHL